MSLLLCILCRKGWPSSPVFLWCQAPVPVICFVSLHLSRHFWHLWGRLLMCWSPNMSKDVFISIYQKSWKLKDGCGTQIYSRGTLLAILYGAYGPVLQILTLFQTKKYHFPHRLSWCWPLNSIPVFTPKWHKNHWKALPICGGTYVYGLYKGVPSGKSLKMIHWQHIPNL